MSTPIAPSDKEDLSADSANPSAEKQQEILEKFDKESITRKLSNKKLGWLLSALAIAYALFHLYITFNPMPALLLSLIHI